MPTKMNYRYGVNTDTTGATIPATNPATKPATTPAPTTDRPPPGGSLIGTVQGKLLDLFIP